MKEVKVKTTNKYTKDCNQPAFSGKIVAHDPSDKHRVLVEMECGCSEWLSVTWLKPIDSKCDH